MLETSAAGDTDSFSQIFPVVSEIFGGKTSMTEDRKSLTSNVFMINTLVYQEGKFWWPDDKLCSCIHMFEYLKSNSEML